MQLEVINNVNQYPRDQIINEVYKAVHPFKDTYDIDMVVGLFVDCLSALDSESGTLYALVNDSYSTVLSYAFIYKATNKSDSAPHLHVLSVPIKHQGNGYASKLLELLLNNVNDSKDISCECQSTLKIFFESHDFKLKSIDNASGLLKMHYGSSPEKSNFMRPTLSYEQHEAYVSEFISHQEEIRKSR